MTSPALFPDDGTAGAVDPAGPLRDRSSPTDQHSSKVRRSALWAAYGDALGWISELTDENGLKRRTSGKPLRRPVSWRRRIGGIGGVIAAVPAGCYSDDTQLRLATGRAIRADGFDVEAFAKVELPVWLSYALGGGKGTSAAAMNLSRPSVPWFSNVFKGWTNSGGNGAAMRIQPHVWASHSPDEPASYLPDVVRNAVCTHSHPTGLMGAVIHAIAVAHALVTGDSPSPEDTADAISIAAEVPTLMANDFEVWNYWRTAFERESGSFPEAWEQSVADSRELLRAVSTNTDDLAGAERYSSIIDTLKLRDARNRGNGIRTAIAAIGLIWCEPCPEEAIQIAANELGTDTDTIATMSGAILGICAESEPPTAVMDAHLLMSEAERLSEIACGGKPPGFRYPDLLHWSAPKTRSDALLSVGEGALWVSGLGSAEPRGEPMTSRQGDFSWQWVELASSQTLLIKRRKTLARYVQASRYPGIEITSSVTDAKPRTPSVNVPSTLDLDRALAYVSERIDDNASVGAALRRVVNRGTKADITAFVFGLVHLLDESTNSGNASLRG